jgi:anti-anti-sigma factor
MIVSIRIPTGSLSSSEPHHLDKGSPIMLQSESRAGVTILTPTITRLDAANAAAFRSALEAAAAARTPVLLDLGNIAFMDSTGIGVLLAFNRYLGKDYLRLCRPVSSVLTIFRVVRLGHVIPAYETREQALAAFLPVGTGETR